MSDSNVENSVNLQDEEPPPILSPGIRDVFHIFVNMLDVKSFMKLSMASKEMHERCMSDKRIEINVKEDKVVAEVARRVRSFCFESYTISEKNIEKYFEKLCHMKFHVSLRQIHFQGTKADRRALRETREYLKELGVRTIESLKIDGECTGWRELSFIKEFNIKDVVINHGLPDDALLPLLQSNLCTLSYHGRIRAELLLQVISPVAELVLGNVRLPSMRPEAVFTEILDKIQTGSLTTLNAVFNRVPWDRFTSVPSDHDGPLPAERPLLIGNDGAMRWFLHWNGNVTSCKIPGDNENYIVISKCKHDLPAVLLSKDSVHKEFAKKRRIRCLRSHFTSFFDGIPVLDELHSGPCPESRPLLCKTEGNTGLEYYLLNEDGSIDVYTWNRCISSRSNYNMDEDMPKVEGHLPLLKFLVKKRIEKCMKEGSFYCENIEDFHCVFEDFEKLPHHFRGELPERRPLVFESTLVVEEMAQKKEDYRVVLYEDGTLIQYRWKSSGNVNIGPCRTWNRPSIMITSKDLQKIVRYAPLKEYIYCVDLGMFRDVFKEFKTLPFDTLEELPSDRPLVFEKTECHDGEVVDQRWIIIDCETVRKFQWRHGQATFSRCDPREFPPVLTKTLVTDFFEGNTVNTEYGFYIDRDVLNQCLEPFDALLFDYAGPLPDKSPLVFKKTEAKHTCQESSDCECRGEILHLYFVSEKEGVVHMTWGDPEDRFLSFDVHPDSNDLPAVLKTKEALEFLLQLPWSSDVRTIPWYGSSEDLASYFESHMMIDETYNDPLPDERPLVFKRASRRLSPVYWFLRYDDLWIKCADSDSHFLLTINPKYGIPY